MFIPLSYLKPVAEASEALQLRPQPVLYAPVRVPQDGEARDADQVSRARSDFDMNVCCDSWLCSGAFFFFFLCPSTSSFPSTGILGA